MRCLRGDWAPNMPSHLFYPLVHLGCLKAQDWILIYNLTWTSPRTRPRSRTKFKPHPKAKPKLICRWGIESLSLKRLTHQLAFGLVCFRCFLFSWLLSGFLRSSLLFLSCRLALFYPLTPNILGSPNGCLTPNLRLHILLFCLPAIATDGWITF